MLSKIINEETKAVNIFLGNDNEWAISQGFTEMEVEQAYNGNWYLKGYAPIKPAPTNEEIKAERERLYVLYADKLKNDYDEDIARYGLESSEALASKKIWLDKKDEIRENNPYNEADEAEYVAEVARISKEIEDENPYMDEHLNGESL